MRKQCRPRTGLKWTEEEKFYVQENVGKLTFDYMGIKLGRTSVAVERFVTKEGILNTKLAGGYLSAHGLAKELGVGPKVVTRWIEQHGFPAKRGTLRFVNKAKKKPEYHIDIDDFWAWAEKNKDRINLSKLEPRILGLEPEWAEAKRREDKKQPPLKRRVWTKEDDDLVWDLFYRKETPQKEIAKRFGVSVSAIEHKIGRLRKQKRKKVVTC